jgi:16S rRNA (guanine(527)-N(7))-methyltransferase GidB
VSEEPSSAVRALFQVGFAPVARYAELLQEFGEERGLIGPREVDRIWSRHIVNCAALLPFLPSSGTVMDVGSGGGLPGIVVACARPDLDFVLVESMEKRCAWLDEVRTELDLDNVQIICGRAEELKGKLKVDAVTARAVANLAKLIRLTSKLIKPNGRLLALKGRRAYEEVEDAAYELRRHHLWTEVHEVTSVVDGETTFVVECGRTLS